MGAQDSFPGPGTSVFPSPLAVLPPRETKTVSTLFLVCAIVGGAVLALQIVLGVFGLGHDWEIPWLDHELGGADAAGDALNLLSVRALSAGILFFGLVGLAFRSPLVALPAAVVAGGAAAVGVAFAMRALMRLESDGDGATPYHAVGETGNVYLSIPAERGGRGKVHLTVKGRLVEIDAVSRHALTTGSSVVVVDVVGPDLVEVEPSPQIGAPDVL